MSDPAPVFVGTFPPIYRSDIQDYYIDISKDLATGETVSSATASVTDSAGTAVLNVVSSINSSTALKSLMGGFIKR